MAIQIILLDDDAMLAESLNELVPWDELGFEVVGVFTESMEALDFLEKHTVSVLITDICMPGMDGIELSRVCKERFPDLKIIFLSAYREFEYAREAIYSGNVVDYITKPINWREFKKSMQKLEMSLNENQPKNTFSSELELDERLQFFSGLLCGELSDESELAENLQSMKIMLDPEKTVCSLVNFHIKNFEELVQEKNKYNAIRMHHAMSNLFPFETEEGYFSLAIYSYGRLVWVVLHKSTDIKGTISNFSEKFVSSMTANLNIDTVFKSCKTYRSVTELVKSPFTDEPEQQENTNIASALAYMKEHFSENIALKDVAQHVYMCPAYFSAYFKRYTGHSFIESITGIRMEKAAELLADTDMIVSEIAIETGYNHLGNFYEKFKKYYDMTPTEYRKKYGRR